MLTKQQERACTIVGRPIFTVEVGSHPAAAAPEGPVASQINTTTARPLSAAAETTAPIDNTLTQAQKDAIIKGAADNPLGIDPARVPVPADVTAAFGNKASANLVHDALSFQEAAQSFHQLQVLPLTASAESITADITSRLGPWTEPQTLADIIKGNNSPDGSPVIPGFSKDQAAHGISVDGKRYHALGQGVFFSNGKPVVSLSMQKTPVTVNGKTFQGPVATVAMVVNIAIPAKEGTANVAQKSIYNLIPTPDGHWLVAGYNVDTHLTATPTGN